MAVGRRLTATTYLVDKTKYYKGWPRESLVRYHDTDREKLKEVIPIRFGQKEGTYMYFHENGEVGIRGEYQEDVKVGKWTEYYPFRRRRKKEVQYTDDPWNDDFSPISAGSGTAGVRWYMRGPSKDHQARIFPKQSNPLFETL